jgi:galactokinase
MSGGENPGWAAELVAHHVADSPSTQWVRAPGRVNLIGEHTDYTEGYVLPVAIDLEIRGLVSARSDRKVNVVSLAVGKQESYRLGEEGKPSQGSWGNYLRGVTVALREAGFDLQNGFDLTLSSTLPVAAGLSSSAALEAVVALAALAVNGIRATPERLAPICRRAENEYVGVGCGVMDQMIVFGGRVGHAMMLDCRSLRASFVSIPNQLAIVVCETGAERALAMSAYNQRLAECARSLTVLGRGPNGVRSLRDASATLVESGREELGPVLYRRCRHIVIENERVLALMDALNADDRVAIGDLMARSHASLRDDYEVSSPELDAMVEAAAQCPGFVGGRLTGAGFGGCTVNFVERSKVEEFAAEVAIRYRNAMGMDAKVYVCEGADGAKSGDMD